MIALYIILILIAIIGIVAGIYARKKITECNNEQERKLIKAKWQLICGLIGLACIIISSVLIFIVFK